MNDDKDITSEVELILANASHTLRSGPPTTTGSAWERRLQAVRALLAAADPLPAVASLLYQLQPRGGISVVPLPPRMFVVGRSVDADLSLPEIGRLSRKHFALVPAEGCWVLRHLSGTNPTLLNHLACGPECDYPLLDGDAILAGQMLFAFVLGTETPS